MTITSDWHIHSRNSCDAACMLIRDLVDEASRRGITDFGITDHLHTPFNLPDLVASRAEYLENSPGPTFHFGVEVSCVSKWELAEVSSGRHERPVYGVRSGGPAGGELSIGMTAEEIERYAIEFVVGGTHWPMYVPFERKAIIADYHRQNMFLATHPLVDIVAHPWWWMGHWQRDDGCYPTEPWFDDFGVIPDSMHDEFASAAVEHGTAVEINVSAMLMNKSYPDAFIDRYLDYLASLQSRGVRLSIGSDCHREHYTIDFERTGAMLEKAGIRDDLWCLPSRAEE